MLLGARPRVLITGACKGVGCQCAELFAERGAELILADIDTRRLERLSASLGAVGHHCDVACEESVTRFAADILPRFPELDMIINAAGGGYERTLGMYRISRALLPALSKGVLSNILLNIPPDEEEGKAAIFPYASSQQAFQRLCAALAAETRGSAIRVLIGRPDNDHLTHVLPDRNAGILADAFDISRHANDEKGGLAHHIAALIHRPEDFRRAS